MLPDTFDEIRRLGHEVAEVRAQEQRVLSTLGRFGDTLKGLCRLQDCLEAAGQQQQLLAEEHYQRHVIEPLQRMAFPLYDLLSSALDDPAIQEVRREKALVLRWVTACQTQLRSWLSVYGITAYEQPEGVPFDPACMAPNQRVNTTDAQKDGCVARSVKPGFRRAGRVLRPQVVDLYRYSRDIKNSATTTAANGQVPPANKDGNTDGATAHLEDNTISTSGVSSGVSSGGGGGGGYRESSVAEGMRSASDQSVINSDVASTHNPHHKGASQ